MNKLKYLDRVLVRHKNNKPWMYDIFLYMHGSNFRCIGSTYPYCIKYDINKELYGKV